MTKFEQIKKEMLAKEDKLGQKIDSGILDLVVSLNCLGFNTDSSCEGHLKDKGIFFPWVIIIEDDSKNNNSQLQDFHFLNLDKQYQLIKLLSEFYKERTTAYEHRLITGIIPGCGTELMPMSGYSSSILNKKDERVAIYDIYKKEIKDFTIFLESKVDNL